MIFASVCSGIEAASVAWRPLGWRAAWLSEIDPFASSVLAARQPEAPNLGDLTKITEETIARHGHPDLLVGGTPCQSFSVAGLRRGLDDPRGNLALGFLRLLDRTRARWMVWENVPGVLSSGRGRDFGAFLGALGALGYGWAYRVLDAQHFGLAQRRKRVFVVAHLGGLANRAAAVLFERASLRGDPAPSREAGTRPTAPVTCGTSRSGGGRRPGTAADDAAGALIPVFRKVHRASTNTDHETWEEAQVANTLNVFDVAERDTHAVVAFQCHGSNVGPMGTLRAGNGNEAGGVPFIVNPEGSTAKASHARPADTARCLDSTGGFSAGQGGTVVACPEVALPLRAGRTYADTGDGTSNIVAFHVTQDPISGPVAPCVSQGSKGGAGVVGVADHGTVRRLTPRECERLQGFPDDYTLVSHRGKPAADGPRYRAIGNSMAVPVMAWIGRRIDLIERITS